MKPKVNSKPVASRYETPDERIIEYPGGLISIRDNGDKTISVQLYRTDPNVSVSVSYDGIGKAKAANSGSGVIITKA